jgi:RHS repeat-associated protein
MLGVISETADPALRPRSSLPSSTPRTTSSPPSYGLKPNVPDYMVNGGKTYRIVSDGRGNVRLVLDTTKTGTAAVVQQIDYDEWGNVTNLIDPACTVGGTELCFQPFGFAGGIWEPATGLVRFGARDYDPMARRWVSKDPIRFDGGMDLFVLLTTMRSTRVIRRVRIRGNASPRGRASPTRTTQSIPEWASDATTRAPTASRRNPLTDN